MTGHPHLLRQTPSSGARRVAVVGGGVTNVLSLGELCLLVTATGGARATAVHATHAADAQQKQK